MTTSCHSKLALSGTALRKATPVVSAAFQIFRLNQSLFFLPMLRFMPLLRIDKKKTITI